MTMVQIDDLDCPYCKRITMGELNINTQEYRCLRCGKIIEMEEEDDI